MCAYRRAFESVLVMRLLSQSTGAGQCC